jgi:hypothetical protein
MFFSRLVIVERAFDWLIAHQPATKDPPLAPVALARKL